MSKEQDSISTFIKPIVEEPSETAIVKVEDSKSTSIVPISKPTVAIDEHKKQLNHARYLRMKERLNALKANQTHGCRIILFNIDGRIKQFEVSTEEEYKNMLTNMLSTLKDNELLTDYLITSR